MKISRLLAALAIAVVLLAVAWWNGSYAATRPQGVPAEAWRSLSPELGILLDAEMLGRLNEGTEASTGYVQGVLMTRVGDRWVQVSLDSPAMLEHGLKLLEED